MNKRMFGLKKQAKEISRERIEILFNEAKKAKNPETAKRYVQLARKISTRTKTKMPASFKIQFCKKCNAYLVPGKSCTIRTRNKKIVYTCLACNARKIVPFAREKAQEAKQKHLAH
ncbi:MAG: ribonuclease P [Nanoarchaeota archaeon]|nr:ribonuclease P [Nanoarchaeota archaeon]